MVIAFLALLFNGSAEENIFIVSITEAREDKNSTLKLSRDIQQTRPFCNGDNHLLSSYG